MWDVYSKNFWLRGVGYLDADPNIVKKYSKAEVPELGPLTYKELVERCDKFLTFKHGNIFHGSSEEIFKNAKADAESAYPLVNESFYGLLCEFLEHKLEYGTRKEKEIYNGMSACDLVTRLLTKRCATYFGRNENYLLVTGERGQGDFSTVGTDNETSPLVMENCLTRDEIKLTGFVLISSKVTKVIREKSYSVVMIGIPFPILNREELFEYEDIMVTKRQNTLEKGYGSAPEESVDSKEHSLRKLRNIWGTFYMSKMISFKRLNKKRDRKKNANFGRYVNVGKTEFLDVNCLAVRFSIITIAILTEANKRAAEEGKMAYAIIDREKIGFGNCLPLWDEIFLRNLSYELLCNYRYANNLFGLHFVGFNEIETLKNGWKMYITDGVWGNQHPNEGVEIKFSTREEFNLEEILKKEEYLVVETYRLEANALPGNELWVDKVSKDPSHPSFDVRHTAVPFIHNAHINPTRLCGSNLRCYSTFGGLCPWKNIHAVNY